WSLRRHRYETAYIERNIKGYAPVLVHNVELAPAGRGKAAATPATWPGFSICMEKKDGQRYRRDYAFMTNIVRFAGERPCEAPPPITQKAPSAAPLPVDAAPASQPSERFSERFKRRLKAITGGLFGS